MSPRPGPRMAYLGLRLTAEQLAWLDAQAKAHEQTRSEVLRAIIDAARVRPQV